MLSVHVQRRLSWLPIGTLLFLLTAALCSISRADTLVMQCESSFSTSTNCGGCTAKFGTGNGLSWVTPSPSVLVKPADNGFYVALGQAKPDQLIAVSTTASPGPAQCSQITGSATASSLLSPTTVVTPPAPPSTPPASPPAPFKCLPEPTFPVKASWGNLPDGVSVSADKYAAWVCDTPAGYMSYAHVFLLSDVIAHIWNYIKGTFGLADANALCQSKCWSSFTTTEQAFNEKQLSLVMPVAVVSTNGSTKTRAVYRANADGTINSTAVSTSRVTVGVPCNASHRIAGSNYYSVEGQPDASNAGKMLGEVYAICTVTLPFGANKVTNP
jgi:hypothetical protein